MLSERAEEVLERAKRISVSEQAFARFLQALDQPAEEMPTLARYAGKQSPIPAR